MKKPKYPGKSVVIMTLQSIFLKNLLRSRLITAKIELIIEMLDYFKWLQKHFGRIRISNSREKNWQVMSKYMHGSRYQGVEFGVAWGYLTWWWFKNSSDLIESWHGFDRFTGLPRDWRNFKKGTFDTGGNVPDIQDNRITWYKGDLEEQIQQLQIANERDYKVIIFFDLDIFEPSLVGWQNVKHSLKNGDILYFDEAFDKDERKLLDEFVLPSGEFEFIGCSWLTLSLRVKHIYS